MKDKYCIECQLTKSENEFYIVKGYSRKRCKKCECLRSKRWTKENKLRVRDRRNTDPAHRIKQNISNSLMRVERKKILIDELGGKCSSCGYNKCNEAIDFHHKNKKYKGDEIGSLLSNTSMAKIREEIKNGECILLCSNCHREHHSLEYKVKLDKMRIELKLLTENRKYPRESKYF